MYVNPPISPHVLSLDKTASYVVPGWLCNIKQHFTPQTNHKPNCSKHVKFSVKPDLAKFKQRLTPTRQKSVNTPFFVEEVIHTKKVIKTKQNRHVEPASGKIGCEIKIDRSATFPALTVMLRSRKRSRHSFRLERRSSVTGHLRLFRLLLLTRNI